MNEMNRKNPVLVFFVFCILSHHASGAESTPLVRNGDAPKSLHVMLCTNKIALLQAHGGAVFSGPIQRAPGASAGATFLGTVIGVLLVGNYANKGIPEETEFRRQLSNRLVTIDFEKLVNEQYQTGLAGLGKRGGTVWEVMSDSSDMEQAGLLVRIAEKNTLTLDATIQVDSKIGNLTLITSVNVWQKNLATPVFSQSLSNKLEPEANGPRNRWTEDNGERLAGALRQSIDQSVETLLTSPVFLAVLESSPEHPKAAESVAVQSSSIVPPRLPLSGEPGGIRDGSGIRPADVQAQNLERPLPGH